MDHYQQVRYPNGTVSIPMTSSDRQRRDPEEPILGCISGCIPFDLQRPDSPW